MRKQLRYYQTEAVNALLKALKDDKDCRPYAKLCTGAGKSLIAAHITDLGLKNDKRILQIVPRKKLVIQNHRELKDYCSMPEKVGICSASMNKFQMTKDAIVSTPMSFLNRAKTSGKFDLVIVDEAHLFAPQLNGTHWQIVNHLLNINPDMRVMGVTATPYRTDMGNIHNETSLGKNPFTHIVYESDMARMMEEGYLSKIKDISGDLHADIEGVPVAGKDYDANIMGARFDEIISHAVPDMLAKFKSNNIRTALIFASNIDNAKHIRDEFASDEVKIIHSKLNNKDIDRILEWLETGEGNRYLVNVDILTTGFDFPALDAVVMMRATKSRSLFEQIIGRAIRAHCDKPIAYLIDYGTNVERLGGLAFGFEQKPRGVSAEKEKREVSEFMQCPSCKRMSPRIYTFCVYCDEKLRRGSNDYAMRSEADLMNEPVEYKVTSTIVEKAWSKKNEKPMIKIKMIGESGTEIHSHYLCLEHGGIAKSSAETFLMNMMKNPSYLFVEMNENGYGGTTVDNVLEMFDDDIYDHFFYEINSIKIIKEGAYNRLLSCTLKK